MAKTVKIKKNNPKMNVVNDDQLQKDIVARAKELKKGRLVKKNPFPVQCFHPILKDFCESHHRSFGYPVDWYGAGVLAVLGTLAGNAFAAEYDWDWDGSPLFWITIVGRSASGKSQVMRHCERPINKLQGASMSKISSGFPKKEDEEEEPIEDEDLAEILKLNKFTLEIAIRIMQRNQRGLLVSRSELIGWLKSMNAYKKGDDEQTWLEFHDNQDMFVALVKRRVFLRRTFLSVWGGVQDDLLHEFADGQKKESGQFGRCLFAYPDSLVKPLPSKTRPNRDCIEKYMTVAERIHNYPNHIHPDVVRSLLIPFNDKAKGIYFDYLSDSTREQNEADNNLQRSVLGKLETYVIRFACALKVMDMACEGFEMQPRYFELKNDRLTYPGLEIGEDIIKRALLLKNYFKETSNRVTTHIESPVNKLDTLYQEWYRALPMNEEIKTNVILDSARKLGISQRTAERLASNQELFKKIKTGYYGRRCF